MAMGQQQWKTVPGDGACTEGAGTNSLSDPEWHHQAIAKSLEAQFLYNIPTQSPVSKPSIVVRIYSPRTL